MAAPLCVTVLAAGKGTRMRNALPKVLHPLAGRTLIEHVLANAQELRPAQTVVVLAAEMSEVAAVVARSPLAPAIVIQEPQLGTGHAVKVAQAALPASGTVLVLFGDTPLLRSATLARLVQAREAVDAAVAVLGMRPTDPAGYGRLQMAGERLVAVIEDRDAEPDLKRAAACNSGVMAFDAARLPDLLAGLALHGDKGEYYLTDTVALAVERGWTCVAVEGPAEEGSGVNSQAQLAEAGELLQRRLRQRLLDEGVIVQDPGTLHLCADTEIAPGAVIEPYVVMGPGVRIGAGATDPQLLPHRAGDDRGRGRDRAVRPAAAGFGHRRARQDRQFRRDQEHEAGARRQGQPSELSGRHNGRIGGQCRRRDDHLQL